MNEVKHRSKQNARHVNPDQKCTGINVANFPETICLLHIHISVDNENKFTQAILQKHRIMLPYLLLKRLLCPK